MSESVNLVIYPEIQDGNEIDEVKEKLCKTLSVDAETVDTWYATSNPTAILKDVEEGTAQKYLEAILKTGAQANLQPAGEDKSSWSLEQMTKADIRDLFICPSCEYEEQMERGEKLEQCPECGLVIAKWEEKMREEAEKEKIRRRLMRDQRLKGDREAELAAKEAELERLKALEAEIMKELGIRPPSKLWLLFEKYTITLSFAFTAMVMIATGIAFQYADSYVDELAHQQAVDAEPSAEIQAMAPTVADAVGLQQAGKNEVISDIAEVTEMLRGRAEQNQAIVGMASQMMKGVEAEKFLSAASSMSLPATTAKLSEGEVNAAPVNIDTIGGVGGMQGISSFSPDELTSISPPLLEHGHEEILSVLSEKRVIKDHYNPEGPDLIVEAIDEMDGSAIVDLMSTISRDQEWDQYLLSHVKQYLLNGQLSEADTLADRIKNPVVRLYAFGHIMEELVLAQNAADIKILDARIGLDLGKIEDPDIRARVILDLGEQMVAAGSESEPYESIEKVERMAADADSPAEEANLTSRLAVAYLKIEDRAQAKRLLTKSMRIAGRIEDLGERIAVFTRIAQRYYDARNNTLAAEILSEAAIIGAGELEQQERSVAFAEIAIAQAYIGDFVGARMSIDNASEGNGKQQLIAKIAEMLIGEERYYEALSWMESLENETEYARLELRLSSALFYEDRGPEALNRLEQSVAKMQRIYELSERGLLTSQYARLFARLGRDSESEHLFGEAEKISQQLTGRKSQVNLALVALDRARVLQLGRAKEIVVDELTDTVVKDPIDTEILATERIIKNLLPEDLIFSDEP